MRGDLVALTVATLVTVALVPVVVSLVVDASRSWRAARHYPNGRRDVALALVRSAHLRAAKAVVTLAMVGVGWLILLGANPPVRAAVTVFVWLLAVTSALTWLDVWWTQRVRRALYRQELRAQDQVRRARRDLR